MAQTLHGTMTIVYYIASPTWGGGEQYVFDLARQMQQHYGIRPVFIFPPHSDPAMVSRFSEIGECPIFRYTGKLFRFSPWAARQLARLLECYQADVLHINSRRSYFQAAMAKHFAQRPIRLIAVQHLVRRAKNTPLWRWAYRQIDTLICVSQCVRKAYLAPFADNNPFGDVQVIHNSVPIPSSNRIAEQKVTIPTIFYHGRICREKGIFQLLQTLEHITLPFRMVIAGSVAKQDAELWERHFIQSPIRDRLDYIGFRTDITDLLPQYQIGVIPTLIPEAGGPLSLLENMACGIPTVTSDNGSQCEFIRNGENGILCPPDNQDAWLKALESLLSDAQLRLTMGQQAQQDFYALHQYQLFLKQMHTLYTR